MDLAEMRSRVFSPLRDSDKVFISDDDVTDWLNEAYSDLATRLDIVEAETTGTTDGTANLAYPVDPAPEVLRPILLRLETDDVEFVDSDTFYAWADIGAIPVHTIAYVFSNNVQLWPIPSAGVAYVFRYTSVPAPLSGLSDIPAMPSAMQTKMIQYAQAEAFYKLDDSARGDRKTGQYESGLPVPPLGMDKLIPGPFTLSPEFGPFDITPDATHL